MNTVIIQQGCGVYADMLAETDSRHREFAAWNNAEFISVRGDLVSPRPPHWNKIALVRQFLDSPVDWKWIIWIDADCLVWKPQVSFADVIQPDRTWNTNLLLAMHSTPWGKQLWHWNTGVMFIRNTSLVRQFFKFVWDLGPCEHPWQEQQRVLQALEHFIPLYPDIVQELPGEWNLMHWEVVNPMIRAYHGLGEKALDAIRTDLKLS